MGVLDDLEQALVSANEHAVAAAMSEARLHAILASVADGVVTVDSRGLIESANPASERLFGVAVQDLLGQPIVAFVPDFDPDQPADVRRETDAQRVDGSTLPIDLSVTGLDLPEERLLITVIRDISDRRAAAAELERLAGTDALTGLANRHRATQELERMFQFAERQGQPLALGVVDLDRFKQINDEYGHATGDDVLRLAGGVLSAAFRDTDVVARWGGEEFLVALYGSTKDNARRRLEEALHAFRRLTASAMPVASTFSAGLAEFPADGRDLETLFRSADGALYRAKAEGRASVQLVETTEPRPVLENAA